VAQRCNYKRLASDIIDQSVIVDEGIVLTSLLSSSSSATGNALHSVCSHHQYNIETDVKLI